MFKRKIYETLVNWKKNDSKECALLIDGARRVGKSFIVEEFAKAEYKSHKGSINESNDINARTLKAG